MIKMVITLLRDSLVRKPRKRIKAELDIREVPAGSWWS